MFACLFIYYFKCMFMCLGKFVCNIRMQKPVEERLEQHQNSSIVVTGNYEAPFGCWGLNLAPLQKQ